MHRKVRKNQLGSFSLQATAFVSFITKMFWGTAQAVTPVKTLLVFQSNQGSAGFSRNSSKLNYQTDQQHNFLDVVCPQVYVLSPKNTKQLQYQTAAIPVCCYLSH